MAAVDWDPAGGTPPRAAGVKATAEWYVTGGPGVQDAESSRMAAGPSLRAEQQSGGPWGPLGARRRPLLQPRSVSFFSSTFSVTLTSRCFAFKDSDR